MNDTMTQLWSLAHQLECNAGVPLDELEVDAASLLLDVCRALGLSDFDAAIVLGTLLLPDGTEIGSAEQLALPLEIVPSI